MVFISSFICFTFSSSKEVPKCIKFIYSKKKIPTSKNPFFKNAYKSEKYGQLNWKKNAACLCRAISDKQMIWQALPNFKHRALDIAQDFILFSF